MKKLLITGGAGFIGSNLVKYLVAKYPEYKITVLDALTYAGNLDNFPQQVWSNPNFCFYEGNILNRPLAERLMGSVDAVLHLAAETHVDRSIARVDEFVKTDIEGTLVLLETLKKCAVERFIYVSTSEVYGTAQTSPMDEEHPLNPQSPYAACKAAADRLAYSYFVTFDLPIVILRPFNNYGPNQYLEKLIPAFITKAIADEPLPVYGSGRNTRDWLYVEDCCEAMDLALHGNINKVKGQVINLGTGWETNVLTIADRILENLGKPKSLIKHIVDRPGHVERHVACNTKAYKLLSWKSKTDINWGLQKTILWYKENVNWWKREKTSGLDY